MKKLILFLLTLALVLALAACEKTPAGEGEELPENLPEETVQSSEEEQLQTEEVPDIAGLANPMTAYDTLDEVNEIVGSRLCTPGVMGVSDQAYFVINAGSNQIAEEQFTVGGQKYSFRCAPVADHDISGLYIGENGTAFEGMEMSDELQYVEKGSYKAARWFTIDGQYVLSVCDEGSMEKDTFLAIAEELRSATLPGMSEGELTAFYADLAGEYADSVSQRAMAKVTADGSSGITVVVSWSSSAFETERWTMNACRSEEGLISYPSESKALISADADGNVTETLFDSIAVPGWFELKDGALLWTGANDETCRDCVFEKIPDAE